VKIAIVGAGPAGGLLAYLLARDGAAVTVFDPTHPREKPCGGGLTSKALDLLPAAPADDPLPARRVDECVFESAGDGVRVPLPRPMAVASRRELDGWILRQARRAGARHVSERVAVVERGRLRTAAGSEHAFDLVAGADGANSLVRRTFGEPIPTRRRMMATGWFARGDATLWVRFTERPGGYVWLFPRPDHVGVGICAPLAEVPTRQLLGRLEQEVARRFPALAEPDGGRYAHTIPSPSAEDRSLLEIAGDGWALLGDAAALADPITGEGIYYALRSAQVLAATLREGGSPRAFAEALLEDCGRELLRAAALRDWFYRPGFVRRMVRYGGVSGAIRRLMGELVTGEQGYLGLRRRLLLAAPRLLLDHARARVFRRAA
jgi:flavin-dependent dehydrogenase